MKRATPTLPLAGLPAALLLVLLLCPTATAQGADARQRLLERAFGEAARLDPAIVARVVALPAGRRLFLDTDGDGKNNEVWYIDTAARHGKASRPLLVRAIDEDGDLDDDGGPDLDSDLYLADWRADGSVDTVVDYQDNDGDGDVDEMAMYFVKQKDRYLGNQPGLMAFWGRDLGDDNQLWYDENLTYRQVDCQYRSHFSGDEIFLMFGLVEGATEWRSINENPFVFYDPDGDGCSEVTLRLSGSGSQVDSLRYSVDADDDAFGRRTHDYDFSITAVAAGLYLPENAARTIRYPDRLTMPFRLRGIPTQPWIPAEHAETFARAAPWNRTLLTWDEMNANTEARVDHDPHERWEGILNQPCEDFPQVGGPATSKLNKRCELCLHPVPPLRLYYHPADRRLHLAGAEKGWLDIDFDLDGKVDALYTWLDEDGDGVLDRRRLDVDGDGVTDFDWKMEGKGVRPIPLEFRRLSGFYRPQLVKALEDSQAFIDAAKAALADGTAASDPVEEFFLHDLEAWHPDTGLGGYMRRTPAGARLYVDLLRDRLLLTLRERCGASDAWEELESCYARGDYPGAAKQVARLLPAVEPLDPRGFEDYRRRIELRLDNRRGTQRDGWPVSFPVSRLRAVDGEFDPAGCAVVAGERWIGWRRIPHQVDGIDAAVGEEISFLVDLRAGERASYFLYYHPTRPGRAEFPAATATAEDWVPPNIGWESGRAAYRAYWGQFDFFGKKTDRLIYPDIGTESYHAETPWGIDALHVDRGPGLGGLSLYSGGKAYRAYNPAGEGEVVFEKRVLVQGPVRAAVEISARNVIPETPEATMRLLCIIYAGRQETEIRAQVTGVDADLAPGFTKLKREETFLDAGAGVFGSWGRQDAVIDEIGMGMIFSPRAFAGETELTDQRQVRLHTRGGQAHYWLLGDWRRGRQHPIAPTVENWKRELTELSQLLHDVSLSVGAPERVLAAPGTTDTIGGEARKAFTEMARRMPSIQSIREASGAVLAWGESYHLMSCVAMFEATRDRAYLDQAIARCDAVLAVRDDRRGLSDEIRGKVMPAWSSLKYTKGKRYTWIVHAGMLTQPMARIACLVRRDPDLYAEYGATADRYLEAVAETVHAFDADWRDGPVEGEGFYYGEYKRTGLPLNMQNAMGRTLVDLWLATGKREYRDRAEKLALFFKHRCRPVDNRYVWSYSRASTGAEDISHAAINVDFAFVCHRAGLVFTREDMHRFANTLKYCSRGQEGFTKTVDGRGDYTYSAAMGRWGRLGFIEPEIRVILHEYLRENWTTSPNAGMVAASYLLGTQHDLVYEHPTVAPR